MRIDILTLFPEMFPGPLAYSIVGRALERGLVELRVTDIRAFARDRHRTVDDAPFGGGGGMVLKVEPLAAAIEHVAGPRGARDGPVILLSPQGRRFEHGVARELARASRLTLVCGHYEGVDERVRELLVDDELSIGDYVLTGGELPAMVVVDAVSRFVPGVLGEAGAAEKDSFATGLLEYPQYTRPRVFRGVEVPPVLLSGDHAAIAAWRRRESIRRTARRRPDLLARAALTPAERAALALDPGGAGAILQGEGDRGS